MSYRHQLINPYILINLHNCQLIAVNIGTPNNQLDSYQAIIRGYEELPEVPELPESKQLLVDHDTALKNSATVEYWEPKPDTKDNKLVI